jgi:hypothetical protein
MVEMLKIALQRGIGEGRADIHVPLAVDRRLVFIYQ